MTHEHAVSGPLRPGRKNDHRPKMEPADCAPSVSEVNSGVSGMVSRPLTAIRYNDLRRTIIIVYTVPINRRRGCGTAKRSKSDFRGFCGQKPTGDDGDIC